MPWQRRKFIPAKTHPCPWCGEMTEGIFCKPDYAKLDGITKQSIRNCLKMGAPKAAIRSGLQALEKLAAGGVPLKPRMERTVAP